MNLKNGISGAFLIVSSVALSAQQPPVQNQQQTTVPESQIKMPAAQPAQSTPALSPGETQAGSAKPAGELPPVSPNAGAPSAEAKPAGVDNARYIIGPEDALQITVWREPSISGNFPVRPDGMISMVLLGDLPAAGMTPTALSADIGVRLRKYFQDPPSVTVQVMAVNSQRIYLIGEVGHVGPVPLSSGMTPLQAIATGGGLSPFANAKHIYILRGTGSSQQKIPFNYKQALKGDDHQQIVLRPGDTIVVP